MDRLFLLFPFFLIYCQIVLIIPFGYCLGELIQNYTRTQSTSMANMKRSSSASLLALAYYLFIICFNTHALSTSPITNPPIIPITVLSGFLGTGKTTLLQEMLENKQGLRIGVVVNDVASVNIDSKLVAGKTTATNKNGERGDANSAAVKAMPDGMVELQNGCA